MKASKKAGKKPRAAAAKKKTTARAHVPPARTSISRGVGKKASPATTARAARKKLQSPAPGKKLAKKLAKKLGKKTATAPSTRAKKIPGPSKRRPRPAPIRQVRASSAPSVAVAARALGVTALQLLDLIRRRVVRAVLDQDGNFHVPAVRTQKKELAARDRAAQRKKKRSRPLFSAPAPRKKTKKTPGKKAKRRKKKVVPVRRPPRPPAGGPVETTVFGPVQFPDAPPPPPVISRDTPMPMEAAARLVGAAMRDFVTARLATEREATQQQWYGLKTAFKKTYGTERWNDVFDWLIDEFDLEDFVFDREALRDS